MARTKFEVGKVYVTMNDTFCEGDGKGKSAVIKRTDTTVYFKNLSSGEEFEREVTIYDGADVEGCDAFDVTDNFIADNFGVEIEICESEIKAAVSEYNAIGEHFDEIMDVAVDESLPNWEREQKKLISKHYRSECKEKAKFLRKFFAEIGIPEKVLKTSVSYDYSDILGTTDYTIEIVPKTEKISVDQLEKIAGYFESRYTEVAVEDFDFYEFEDVLDEEDAEISIKIVPETETAETADNETTQAEPTILDKLRAKIAEQKSKKVFSQAFEQGMTMRNYNHSLL